MTVAPLHGVRVVDLTRLVAGDYCSGLLAALGADVVKIEDTGRGDYIGDFGGRVHGASVADHLFNRGKRSVRLDLKTDAGLEVLRRLVAASDMLVESFRPGVMARLGLSSAAALEINPRLVWVSISAHGATGPRADVPGHDLNYLAESGILHRMVGADGRPVAPPIPFADLIGGGLLPALTAVSTLLRARETGVGGVIDASITEGTALLPSVLLADVFAGVPVAEDGRRTFLGGGYACYDVYRLADGHVVVGALEEKFWRVLCEALERADLIGLQWDDSAQDRVRAALTDELRVLTRADIVRMGLAERACVSIVRSYEEVVAAGVFAESSVPTPGGGFCAPGLPFRIDGRRIEPADRILAHGADTRRVLAELGCTPAQIDDLLASGAARAD